MFNILRNARRSFFVVNNIQNSLKKPFSKSPRLFEKMENPGAKTHKPNNLEKRFLVWTGKYKSLDEVPQMVSNDVMERSRNKMRIRIANYMIIATAIGCIVMVISGKRALQRGESVTKQNLEWHKQYNEVKEGETK